MTWLVWRRQRAALLFASGLLAAMALLLLAGAGRDAPAPTGGPTTFVLLCRTILLILPGVVGVVVGAGLFGRELEQGTHVFALTQSVGRVRWWLTGLAVAGLPAAVGVALVTALAGWVLGPAGLVLPLGNPFFDGSGLLPVGHVLLAFTVTATAGLVARNALVAVAVGVGLVLVAQIVLAVGFRPTYLAPEASRVELAALFDGGDLDRGRRLATTYLDDSGRPVTSTALARCAGPAGDAECLRSVGAAQADVVYQPASRYWPFQWIETVILLALSAAALAVGFWGLRNRVS